LGLLKAAGSGKVSQPCSRLMSCVVEPALNCRGRSFNYSTQNKYPKSGSLLESPAI